MNDSFWKFCFENIFSKCPLFVYPLHFHTEGGRSIFDELLVKASCPETLTESNFKVEMERSEEKELKKKIEQIQERNRSLEEIEKEMEFLKTEIDAHFQKALEKFQLNNSPENGD